MNRTAEKYSLRIVGLPHPAGAIGLGTLVGLLGALQTTAERATRLVATGTGRSRGPLPSWLRAAMDLQITGLDAGSTIVGIAAPTLGTAAPGRFEGPALWMEPPKPDETALDLTAQALAEAQDPDAPGDRFDESVLEAAGGLDRVFPFADASWNLEPANPQRTPLRWRHSTAQAIGKRLREIPPSRRAIVTGILDEIGHRKGQFRLRVKPGRALRGTIQPGEVEVEALRGLWGHEATVTGIVHFKRDGTVRRMDAERINAAHSGDVLFRELPTELSRRGMLFPPGEPSLVKRGAKLPTFKEPWPGDETLEELLADLD